MSFRIISAALDSESPLECAVIGTGYMGGGIAQVLALHGHRVRLADINVERTQASRERLLREGEAYAGAGLFPADAAAVLAENLVVAESYEAALSDTAYVAEAVPERIAIKQATLEAISAGAPADAVIGSNTSSIPIRELSEFVDHPQRFLGVHWMNPAPFIPGVEIIPGPHADEAVLSASTRLIDSLGKVATRVSDSAGFVSNRLQFALYAEAARIVEEGLASPAEVDAVVSSCFGFRLAFFGPFAIGDMAGLDVYAGSYETLEREFGSRFAMPEPVREAISSGNLGVKTGSGLLPIDQDAVPELLKYRETAYARLSQLRQELGEPPAFRNQHSNTEI
ncbi:MAG: 3-hydroxyacyl-CoA dehydrogenase family protein [Gulosibacter sp.]|uniref:3-hydroxyacyl-CoA dehydrogenase family protein n=1 Tax=Gulosibacter sp. TaxID=2817531 RepID=UPI003F924290